MALGRDVLSDVLSSEEVEAVVVAVSATHDDATASLDGLTARERLVWIGWLFSSDRADEQWLRPRRRAISDSILNAEDWEQRLDEVLKSASDEMLSDRIRIGLYKLLIALRPAFIDLPLLDIQRDPERIAAHRRIARRLAETLNEGEGISLELEYIRFKAYAAYDGVGGIPEDHSNPFIRAHVAHAHLRQGEKVFLKPFIEARWDIVELIDVVPDLSRREWLEEHVFGPGRGGVLGEQVHIVIVSRGEHREDYRGDSRENDLQWLERLYDKIVWSPSRKEFRLREPYFEPLAGS